MSHRRSPPTETPSAGGRVHTVRCGGVWLTEIEGVGAIFRHESKTAAVAAGEAAALCLRARHLVHAYDGHVLEITNGRGHRG